jgi:general stress protein 26
MERDDIIRIAQDLAGADKPFVLATVDAEAYPRLRWMGGLVLEEPLTAYMATGVRSRKVDQIRAKPRAQLLFQTEDFGTVVTLYGTCEILDDPATKQMVWDGIPALANHASGPDDPGLSIIRFTTARVEVLRMAEHGEEPLVAEL